jgi:hypothetical protein
MKKTLSLALSLLVAAFMFSSCDDLTTIEIPFGITTTHELKVNGTEPALFISQSIDLTENADFNKHKSSIKEVGIDSVAIQITDHIGSANQTLSGAVQVGAVSESTLTQLFAITTPLNIAAIQAETAGDHWKTMPTDEAGRAKLASLIKNDPHTAKIVLAGMTNEVPAKFNVHFKIYWAMKATEELI